jgi:uncharacterized protein
MSTEKRGGEGNFAKDPKRAAEAGKKGGQHSHGGQQQQSGEGGRSQHGGNFADDPQRASEAGRKGGQH